MIQYKTLDKETFQKAFTNKEFTLFYQPIMNFETNNFETFEALIRWHHPELGTLPPAVFMKNIAAENMQEEMTFYILDAAVKQILKNQEYGFTQTGINVNLSVQEFLNPNTILQLKHILQQLSTPEYLGLEISPMILSEYSKRFPNNPEYNPNGAPSDQEFEFLEDIRHVSEQYVNLGVTLAMDTTDQIFGSLIRANILDFHAIKVSTHALQREIIADPEEFLNFVQASQEINTPLIAVGIDDKISFKNIYNHHITYAQGYYLCPPLPLNSNQELHEYLSQYQEKKKFILDDDESIQNLHKTHDQLAKVQEEITDKRQNIHRKENTSLPQKQTHTKNDNYYRSSMSELQNEQEEVLPQNTVKFNFKNAKRN